MVTGLVVTSSATVPTKEERAVNTELTVRVATFRARAAIRSIVRNVDAENRRKRKRDRVGTADVGDIGAPWMSVGFALGY